MCERSLKLKFLQSKSIACSWKILRFTDGSFRHVDVFRGPVEDWTDKVSRETSVSTVKKRCIDDSGSTLHGENHWPIRTHV